MSCCIPQPVSCCIPPLINCSVNVRCCHLQVPVSGHADTRRLHHTLRQRCRGQPHLLPCAWLLLLARVSPACLAQHCTSSKGLPQLVLQLGLLLIRSTGVGGDLVVGSALDNTADREVAGASVLLECEYNQCFILMQYHVNLRPDHRC